MLSDSDGEDLTQLTVNEHYAKAYAYKKEREELGRLKEKYGSDAEEDVDDEDSEDLETEDEDGEELTPGVDAAILRLLAKIKRKDPAIYEKDKAVFDEEKQRSGNFNLTSRKPKDKSQPVTLRHQRLAAELESTSRSPSPEPQTHVQEQQELRNETIAAFHHAVDEDDDLLVPREKTKDELEREEEEYRAFLKREVGEDLKGLIEVDKDDIGIRDNDHQRKLADYKAEKMDKKKKVKDGKAEQDDQEFLMNYILGRGWIDREAKRLPTYTEVTTLKRSKTKASKPEDEAESSSKEVPNLDEDVDLDAEDEFDDVADAFESSYNFRFEEPDAATILRHPRNLNSTVRREDTTRKEARERKKARKEEELLKKKEEVKRLKALKMKELKSKLERIGREGGWEDIEQNEAFQELDLDGDWDPDSHDRQMANLYQDDDDDENAEKPTWDDDIDIGDILPSENAKDQKSKKKRKKKKKDEGAEDDGVDIDAMDADIVQPNDDEEWDGTEEMRKLKLDKYMDELYGMEFNDLVGGMPTRFKYATSAPQDFGLSAAEILIADDKDLNQYMGIKKYAPYRKGSTWDSQRPERLKEFKQKLENKRGKADVESEEKPAKKRKGKKERQKLRAAAAEGSAERHVDEPVALLAEKKRKHEEMDVEEEDIQEQKPTKKKKRRHRKSALTE